MEGVVGGREGVNEGGGEEEVSGLKDVGLPRTFRSPAHLQKHYTCFPASRPVSLFSCSFVTTERAVRDG